MINRRRFLASLSTPALLSRRAPAAGAVSKARERRPFNDGWRFFKGEAEGAERPEFRDSTWAEMRLPHDWAIEGPFDSHISPHAGALPAFGTGWYRKAFTLPESSRGRYFTIEFDGAMANSRVWLNGQDMGGRPYGYIGFTFDLTPHLQFGDHPNVLAVRLTPEEKSSRWYPGAGIYRNVWLHVTGPLHVEHWGTYVTTPQVTGDRATVAVRTDLRNRSDGEGRVTLQCTILDAAGKQVSRTSSAAALPPGGAQTMASELTVANPQRWDIDRPYLYMLVSEVKDGGRVVDRYLTPFGIRTIAFDKDTGFSLNGRQVKLQGVCNHHDLGALGTAVNRRATERQLQIMKDAGVNAIRTSHNPPSPELLEFCDRMGLMVMDEAFDMWRIPKMINGYTKYFDEWSERDVRDMVHRDRNHPSIILWSIGNEVTEQGRPDGWKEAKRLVEFFHEEDPTRPTTSAFNDPLGAIKNQLAAQVDVPGINYHPWLYEQIQKDHPSWMIVGSETSSCVSSRGVYHLPMLEKYEKHPSLQLSSYDIITARWAYPPDVEFSYQDRLPNVLGEFVWTGFDYLGEPTPYFGYYPDSDNSHDWPARSSYFGMVDLAGFPKDRYYLYQSVWSKKPMVHVLPHWNWEGREGQNIPVLCYSNGDEVELLLNGKSLGRKKRFSEPMELPVGVVVTPERKFTSKYRLLWQVPYQAGTLTAVAYKDGKPIARDERRTAGAPARVNLIPDRATIQADGDDVSFVTVRIEDKDGTLCPAADHLVRFQITGVGLIAGVDNGNPATVEPFHADYRKAFSGMALLIVRSLPGKPGRVRVRAVAEGLEDGSTEINSHS
ncbi:MAG TPA: beta-galactosidase GalB [Bryobacteraceae bacterium]|jgi:beta-galactosidase|nr:beta-galactosidase GalB [Bryobacteraceae bacterium]